MFPLVETKWRILNNNTLHNFHAAAQIFATQHVRKLLTGKHVKLIKGVPVV